MFLAYLFACQAVDQDTSLPDVEDTDSTTPSVNLQAPTRLALPYAEVGDMAPKEVLPLQYEGEAATLTMSFAGDFSADHPNTIDGDLDIAVHYTGSMNTSALHSGSLSIEVGSESVTVGLAAVIANPDLPLATWTGDDYGERAVVGLPSAPFPHSSGSWTDDSVLIYVPHGLNDTAEVGVVTHLHGHNATVPAIAETMRLTEQFAFAGRNAVLVVPQGPWSAGSSNFGKLEDPDGYAALIVDVFSILYRDGYLENPAIGASVITSHSGGYRGTARILDHGGLFVAAAHLFDSLYAEESSYEAFVLEGGLLRSSYTATGGTANDNEELMKDLEAAGVVVGESFDDLELLEQSVLIGPTDSSHNKCVTDDRNYMRWLIQSELPAHFLHPPELLAVIADGSTAQVTWREERGGTDGVFVVEGSADGATWEDLATTKGASAEVEAHLWIRVSREQDDFRGNPSDVYGTSGEDWLIVDGFD
ncbi:MAG: hypothetical protein HN348_32165, partial [Proteobacteria bacterium]|nr:hypothetical protein [Pseudomonadota bacterium]